MKLMYGATRIYKTIWNWWTLTQSSFQNSKMIGLQERSETQFHMHRCNGIICTCATQWDGTRIVVYKTMWSFLIEGVEKTLKVAFKTDGAKTNSPSITNTVKSCIKVHANSENVQLHNRRRGGFGSSTNKTCKPL
jgi:hypothetical protein